MTQFNEVIDYYTTQICELKATIAELKDQIQELTEDFANATETPCVLESYKQQIAALHKKWQRESDSRKMWEGEAKYWHIRFKWAKSQERLKNADRNRKWCDDATNFLGPFAEALQAWYDKGSDLFGTVDEIADGWNKPGGKYPWEEKPNTTGEERSTSP